MRSKISVVVGTLIVVLIAANIVVAISNVAEVTLGGKLACRFRVSAGGLSPIQRSYNCDRRIFKALLYHIEPSDVYTKRGRWGHEVRFKKTDMGVDMLLATVTEKDARATLSTEDKVVQIWAFGGYPDVVGFLGLLLNASPKEPATSKYRQN